MPIQVLILIVMIISYMTKCSTTALGEVTMTRQAIKKLQKHYSVRRQFHRLYFHANDMDFVFQ